MDWQPVQSEPQLISKVWLQLLKKVMSWLKQHMTTRHATNEPNSRFDWILFSILDIIIFSGEKKMYNEEKVLL